MSILAAMSFLESPRQFRSPVAVTTSPRLIAVLPGAAAGDRMPNARFRAVLPSFIAATCRLRL